MSTNFIKTVIEQPALADHIQALIEKVWPPYIQGARSAGQYQPLDWIGIYQRWPEFQFGLLAADGEHLLAVGNAAPLRYDEPIAELPDDGWDWALFTATEQKAHGIAPNTLCALSITVDPAVQKRGLSGEMVRAMRKLATAAGFHRLIAPVRPTLKSRYPLIPIQAYMDWLNEDGLPFDPWLRTHVRNGGELVKACRRSMSMQGDVAGWQSWTGLPMPGAGHYVVPDLLAPLQVNRESNHGIYVEPNVWVVHPLTESEQ